MKRSILILTILLVALTTVTSITMALDSERDALMALYNSTSGPGWNNNTGWGTADPYCNWYGVICEAGHVKLLDLSGNQLSGPIPPEMGNLSNLKGLDLTRNQLSGLIPPELGNLLNMEILNLWENQLRGPIPPELGNLSNLRYLSLENNQLSGPIPAALSNLSNLESLGLDGNPNLVCWETQAALNWALALEPLYSGPNDVCSFVWLPAIISAGG